MRKPNRPVLGQLEHLEDRSVPATFYVGLASNYTITNNVGSAGLSSGDTVTWNGPTSVTGLIYGSSAFGTVANAIGATNTGDTIRVASNTYSEGSVSVGRSLTFDIAANTTGFSLNLSGGSNNSLTLTGLGSVAITGNSGNNTLTGNDANNSFDGASGNDTVRGNKGNDTITGGSGIDTAVFSSNRANYDISVNGSTVTVVDNSASNNEGTDTLSGLEKLQFADGTVRAVPSKLGFNVGTPSTASVTGLVFGSAFVNSAASGSSIQVTLSLGGATTDGFFSGSNDGTLASFSVNQTTIQMTGSASALNTFLNSGKIKYNSYTSAQRTITLTSSNDSLSESGYTVLNPNTVAPVFTSANSAAVTYGNSVNFTVTTTSTPAANYSITTGSLPSGISLNGSTGLLSGSTNAGTYSFTITANNGSQTTNQAFTLTVNQAALTVTATAQSKTYGDTDPALTYSVTAGALVGSDAFTGALSRASGENVGTYAVNQGTLSAGSNYTVSFVGANLTVGKATLGISADAQSKTYGDSDPSLTYVISGLKNGDSSSVVTGAMSRVSGENVGTYAVNQGTLSAGSNYTVSFVGANLTVGKATLGISADAKSKTYGDSDPSLTYVISGLKNGDSSSVVTGALSRVSGENAGTYAINQGTVVASANYDVVYTGANLTVGKATLGISADAQSKTYGDSDPSLTYVISGLKNGDSSSVVTGALSRVSGENAGTYAINQGTVVASANYDVVYTGADLTINKRLVTASATASNKNFDGNASATAQVQVTGLGGDDLSASYSSALFDNASVGFEKTVTVSGLGLSGAAAGNYELTNSSVTAIASIIGSGVSGGTLNVVGNGVDDEIILAINPKNSSQFHLIWKVNGLTTYTLYNLSDVNTINVYGMDGNDKLTMNAEVPRAVNFFGNNGNDTLRGGNYNDSLFGGEGTDTLYGSLGDDNLDGGTGTDTLFGQDGNDTLTAGAGDTVPNTLDGGNGSDTLIGAEGDDTLTGGSSSLTDGDDTIQGFGGNDKIFGGNGNDNLSGGNGVDTIDGGNGNDSINGGEGNDTLNGSFGNDSINGDAGDDTINAGDGNDTVAGGLGNDVIHGTAGDDTLNGGEGNNTIQGGDGNDIITAADGNNFILGQAGNDTISVGNGNNIVVGGLGADTITAGNGNNLVIGGSGLDTITVGNGSNLVIGSSTTYDASESNLRTIQNEWLRTDISTTQKKANLSAGVNGVKLALGQTVIDDLSVDLIFAGSGDNWLWI